jgi:hypothetical protein
VVAASIARGAETAHRAQIAATMGAASRGQGLPVSFCRVEVKISSTPERFAPMKSVAPSQESTGVTSAPLVSMTGTISGGDHGSSIVARADVQMSKPSWPPARFD